MNQLAALEAILFVAGEEGIRASEIARILAIPETETEEAVDTLKQRYAGNPDSALTILETGKRIKLVTKKEYADVVKRYAQSSANTNLSKAVLEVLAIIAYKQPVTRMVVEEIRGVQSSSAIQRLLVHGLIAEKGRLKTPGRPMLYGTTEVFLDYFGLKDLDELPELSIGEEENDNSLFFETFQKTFEEEEG